MKRSRFILTGGIKLTDKILDYRLISPTTVREYIYDGSVCLKVTIPNDMEIIKYKCDNYSTTNDVRLLNELEYKWMRFSNGKWINEDY